MHPMTTSQQEEAFTHTTKDVGEMERVDDPSPCPTCRAFDTELDGAVVRHHEPDCPVFIHLPQLAKRPPGV